MAISDHPLSTREDALDLAESLAELAKGLRKGRMLDKDASIVDEVGVEIALAATAVGAWPQGILTRGKVLGWAHRLLGVAHHISEAAGWMSSTVASIKDTAAKIQGHSSGLRTTGEWPATSRGGVPSEVDEAADTVKRPINATKRDK